MRLHETSPNEPLLAAEYARLSILLDRNAKEGQRVAQEAFDQAPNEPLCVIAQALSLNSLGRAAEGMEVMRKLPPEKLHEPHNAVYAAVLLLDQGQAEAAREFIDSANAAPIFVEEKKLLQEALQKNQANQSPPPVPAQSASPAETPVDISPR
jgi:hypothetical protein